MGKEAKELFTENIILNTSKCKLEGVNGRPNTCPNNPILNPDDHVIKSCMDCDKFPARSTKKDLPYGYLEIR